MGWMPSVHRCKMKKPTEKKIRARTASRNPTEAAVTCRTYASSAAGSASDGVMRNFSSQGSYIETSHKFESGTILILRTVRYPDIPPYVSDEERPRSICLAEVKWRRELADPDATRFGLGLKYLE